MMILIRKSVLGRFNNIFYKNRMYVSSQVDPKHESNIRRSDSKDSGSDIDPAATFKIENISTKYRQKYPKRNPLIKNFFLTKVDTELLTFPEPIPRDDMEDLQKAVDLKRKQFGELLDIGPNHTLLDVIETAKSQKLFGGNIPQHFGGLGYTISEMAYSSEPESLNTTNLSVILNSHRLVSQIILDVGTDEQKQKFLPKLASGELIGAVALFEPTFPEIGCFSTKARKYSDEQIWTIIGEKCYVQNGMNANLFLIFTDLEVPTMVQEQSSQPAVFLVEKSLPGVSIPSVDRTISCEAVTQSTIKFDKVQVPEVNLLGDVYLGESIIPKLMAHSRVQCGQINLAIIQRIINVLTKYVIDNGTEHVPLTEMDLVKFNLSRLACDAYAIQSMIYMVVGWMDLFDGQDIDVEAAAIQAFSKQSLYRATEMMIRFLSSKTLIAGEPTEQLYRDAAYLCSHGEPIDSVRGFIALSGIHHLGKDIYEAVNKFRNPVTNPSYVFGQIFARNQMEYPKSDLALNEYLHPSLTPAAQWLDHSICRLHAGCERLLTRDGQNVITQQKELSRISECAQLLFAMFASVSRSSRSYCIGLQHSDQEILAASCFTVDGHQRVRRLMQEVFDGPIANNDANHLKVGKQICEQGGYFFEHPLKRNF